jgi:hypothetical protein
MRLSGCFYPQCLLRAPSVVPADPVADHAAGMQQTLKAVPMLTLFLQGPGHRFRHAVLLRAVRRDELLLQAVVPDQSGVGPAGGRSNWRLASATVAWPWMMSSTRADLHLDVQRLKLKGISTSLVNST